MASALVLADHLRGHPVLVTLNLKVLIQLAVASAILLNLDLLQALLENGRANLREELTDVLEAHDLVLLQEAGGVGF